ncbi:hypothetical protein GPECTOR_41g702 [Gonium pectorale]|uniref:RNA helicase n=1 Tax=Gonium pectorale TaxID=33097 RepID=A0A150GA64_GONPE|nr:hypothetical protein GPECTOR_41g702 [Gonium pectorale]|eukprot:KXZ46737.1 hypothetical protein GPECTOR_41g702 [Gonium pectorale]
MSRPTPQMLRALRHGQAAADAAFAAAAGAGAAGGDGGSVRLSAEEYRQLHGVRVDVPDCPEPFQTWEDAAFPPAITDVLASARYGAPSSIQAQAWPIALAGRDLVAIASTGSGKTLGFLLPALLHLQARGGDPAQGPCALVLAPTRELAVQIEKEAHRFHRFVVEDGGNAAAAAKDLGRRGARHAGQSGLRTLCLYGGASRTGQAYGLRRRPHLVIATPGRLLDFVEEGQISLNQAKPVAARTITQRVRVLEGGAKMEALEAYLREMLLGEAGGRGEGAEEERAARGGRGGAVEGRRAIVFCKTKSGCDILAQRINDTMPFQAASLHGDKTQAARDFSLAAFRSGRVPVLVATDVAARGLDIPNITAVVNYDMPGDIDSYVHRIGRTGRAGASGDSLALVTPRDAGLARGLVGVLEDAGQQVPEQLRDMAGSSSRSGGSRGGGRGRGRSGGRGRGGGGGGGDGWSWDSREAGRGEERHHRRHPADDWKSGFGGSGGGGGGGGRKAYGGRY